MKEEKNKIKVEFTNVLDNIDTPLRYNEKLIISNGFYRNYIGYVKEVNNKEQTAILKVKIDGKEREVKVKIEDVKKLGMFDFRK